MPEAQGKAAEARIVQVTLDDRLRHPPSPDIEMERHRAVSDLLADNSFAMAGPAALTGPYHLTLSLDGARLVLDVACMASQMRESVTVALSPLRRPLHDYGILCDNFYKTARAGDYHRLEALDMGRRGLHDEAAEILAEALENKVLLDKMTARRLFSLLYVLHMRNSPTL